MSEPQEVPPNRRGRRIIMRMEGQMSSHEIQYAPILQFNLIMYTESTVKEIKDHILKTFNKLLTHSQVEIRFEGQTLEDTCTIKMLTKKHKNYWVPRFLKWNVIVPDEMFAERYEIFNDGTNIYTGRRPVDRIWLEKEPFRDADGVTKEYNEDVTGATKKSDEDVASATKESDEDVASATKESDEDVASATEESDVTLSEPQEVPPDRRSRTIVLWMKGQMSSHEMQYAPGLEFYLIMSTESTVREMKDYILRTFTELLTHSRVEIRFAGQILTDTCTIKMLTKNHNYYWVPRYLKWHVIVPDEMFEEKYKIFSATSQYFEKRPRNRICLEIEPSGDAAGVTKESNEDVTGAVKESDEDVASVIKESNEDVASVTKESNEDVAGVTTESNEDVASATKESNEDVASATKESNEDVAGVTTESDEDVAGLTKESDVTLSEPQEVPPNRRGRRIVIRMEGQMSSHEMQYAPGLEFNLVINTESTVREMKDYIMRTFTKLLTPSRIDIHFGGQILADTCTIQMLTKKHKYYWFARYLKWHAIVPDEMFEEKYKIFSDTAKYFGKRPKDIIWLEIESFSDAASATKESDEDVASVTKESNR